MTDGTERREQLKAVFAEARECTRCPELARTRTQVVFGSGHADADLMFVGEAPGAKEDERGVPFVGAAGKLLDQLLEGVGLQRSDVFIHNCLCCRPPANRDPQPAELENCHHYLLAKIELIQPRVICTLGNFSTKLLRGDPTGITRLHGQAEIRQIGNRAVRLYPLFHPAAALYTRSLLETLQADMAGLPALLALEPPEQPHPPEPPEQPHPPEPPQQPHPPEPERPDEPEPVRPQPSQTELTERQKSDPGPDDGQLGLF